VKEINIYKVSAGKAFEEKRPLGAPWSRWEDIDELNLKEIGFEDVDGLI
jgi:hypothetical protein